MKKIIDKLDEILVMFMDWWLRLGEGDHTFPDEDEK